MVKDSRGMNIKEGDIILFQGLMLTVKAISDGNIIGGIGLTKDKVQGTVLPGSLICECLINFNPTGPIPCFILKSPKEEKDDKVITTQA